MVGDSYGITLGSRFELYPKRNSASSLGTFDVRNIEATQATLRLVKNGDTSTPNKWDHAFARPVHIRLPKHDKLKVRLSKKLDPAVAEKVLASKDLFLHTDQDEFVFVDVVDDVKLGKIAVFRISMRHYDFKKLKLNRVVSADSSDDISAVLHDVGHWNFHFTRAPLSRTLDVSIEFHLLKQDNFVVDGTSQTAWKPDSAKTDMNVKGVIEITGNPDDKFGMIIVNNTSHHLYPHLCYFDVKSLVIRDYLISADGKGEVDPPLLSKSRLAVGYGSSIVDGFRFDAVEEDEPGFFKLILTTSPTSLKLSQAPSPFPRGRGPPAQDVIPKWDVIVVKVMQSPAKKKDQLQ